MVSFIVVSYNHAAFVDTCLYSIKSQTYTDWELIVADDASADNSVEKIQNWLNRNNIKARTNFHTANTGLATTLNECVELCKGEFIKIIAADDFLHPEYLEKVLPLFQNPQIGLVYTDTYFVDKNGSIESNRVDYGDLSIGKNSDELKKQLLQHNFIPALTAIMSAKALRDTGFYIPGKIMEDYDRWLRISQNFDLDFVPLKLGYYRVHDSNISTLRELQLREEEIELKIKYDTTGENAVIINAMTEKMFYIFHGKISESFKKYYSEYPLRNVLLSKSISKGGSLLLYRIKKKAKKYFGKITN